MSDRLPPGWMKVGQYPSGRITEVLRVQHPEHGPVVIKQARDAFLNNADVIERLEQEHRLLSALDGAGWVTLLERSVGAAGDPILVLREVRGGALASRTEVATAALVAAWIRQCIAALARLHELGVAHRDLNLRNMLLSERMEIVLCDLGIARPFGARVDVIEGSYATIAPGQARCEPVALAHDHQSLGLIFRELLDGKPARPTSNLAALDQAMEDRRPPRGCAPTELEDAVAHLLDGDGVAALRLLESFLGSSNRD